MTLKEVTNFRREAQKCALLILGTGVSDHCSSARTGMDFNSCRKLWVSLRRGVSRGEGVSRVIGD